MTIFNVGDIIRAKFSLKRDGVELFAANNEGSRATFDPTRFLRVVRFEGSGCIVVLDRPKAYDQRIEYIIPKDILKLFTEAEFED